MRISDTEPRPAKQGGLKVEKDTQKVPYQAKAKSYTIIHRHIRQIHRMEVTSSVLKCPEIYKKNNFQ